MPSETFAERQQRSLSERERQAAVLLFEDVAVAGADSDPAHEVLEVDADAADDVVEAAFRAKAKDVHPDQGGSRAEWQRLQEAREVMLDGGDP